MTDQNNSYVNNVDDDEKNENSSQAQDAQNAKHSDAMIPKARFDQVNEQKKAAENTLKEVVDSLLDDIPEEYKDIIPDLPPAEKIKWIRSARSKGIFASQAQKHSVSSPDSAAPSKQKAPNLDNMSPYEMMSMGYKK